jgi:hypothetical protein
VYAATRSTTRRAWRSTWQVTRITVLTLRRNSMRTMSGGARQRHAKRIGLVDAIDDFFELLKVDLPYHESDHVLMVIASLAWSLDAWFRHRVHGADPSRTHAMDPVGHLVARTRR